MKFFNKKEEVIDLQLTQYGKKLLSKGQWKPSYYAFFDDNILYDVQWANFKEDTINARKRIQEETPQLKTQYITRGIESDFKRRNDYLRQNVEELEGAIENPSPLDNPIAQSAPLGNSEIGSNSSPRWRSKVYLGEIYDTRMNATGSFATMKIPQIDTRIRYMYDIRNTKDNITQPGDTFGGKLVENSRPFFDGTFFRIFDDQLLLTLLEDNVDFNYKNFDVEVFLVEEEEVTGSSYTPGVASGKETTREVLVPLKFRKFSTNIENKLLMDRLDISAMEDIKSIDKTYVEYYFDLYFDQNIDFDDLCSVADKIGRENLRNDFDFTCPDDLENGYLSARSIYATKVTDDDVEGCE